MKNEKIISLLCNIAEADQSIDCVLLKSYDNADCVNLRITHISQNTITLIENHGFRIVNIGRHKTKDALGLVIRLGKDDI